MEASWENSSVRGHRLENLASATLDIAELNSNDVRYMAVNRPLHDPQVQILVL